MTVSSPDDVLKESLNMQDMSGTPDDFALAKALQEQERAFLMLQGGMQGNGGWQENIFALEPGSSGQRSAPCQRRQQAPSGEAAAGPATEAGLRAESEDLSCSSASSESVDCSIEAEAEAGLDAVSGPWEAADGDEDLRVALELHQAEHHALQQRMLEMAGPMLGPIANLAHPSISVYVFSLPCFGSAADFLIAGMAYDDSDLDLEDDSADPDEMTYEELQALGEAVGVVSKGACQAALSSLQTMAYPCCGSSANSEEQ
eukprot:jgi/Astpho2/6441/fgenesh1_pg.00094_%23_8_t